MYSPLLVVSIAPIFNHQEANRAPMTKHCENWNSLKFNIIIINIKQIFSFRAPVLTTNHFVQPPLPPSSTTKKPIEPHCPNIVHVTWSANSLAIVVLEIMA